MNPPNGYEAPRLYHTMRCKDAEAMIAWLTNVLGFTERVVYRNEGTVRSWRSDRRSSCWARIATTPTPNGLVISAAGGRMPSISLLMIPTRSVRR